MLLILRIGAATAAIAALAPATASEVRAQISGRCVAYCDSPRSPSARSYGRDYGTPRYGDPSGDRIEAFTNRGDALFHAGRYSEALNWYASALRVNPQHAYANLWIAKTYHQLGQYAAAIAHLRRVLALPTLSSGVRAVIQQQLDTTLSAQAAKARPDAARQAAVRAEQMRRDAAREAEIAKREMARTATPFVVHEMRGAVTLSVRDKAGREYPLRNWTTGKALRANLVRTGAKSRVTFRLPDDTVFTVGPESEIELDEFVYDEKTGKGKVSAKVTKGVFRFVTGKVSRDRPQDMKVQIGVGTIGTRGTDFGVEIMLGGGATIWLAAGAIEFKPKGAAPAIVLEPGELLFVDHAGRLTRQNWGLEELRRHWSSRIN